MDTIIEETQEVNSNNEEGTTISMINTDEEEGELQELQKRPPHSRSRKRLLLPFERSLPTKTQKSPKKRKKTYRKLSNQDKRMISYAKSIVDSISELQSRSVISEIEDAIFSNHEESNHQLESVYLTHFYHNTTISTNQADLPSNYQVIDSDTWNIPEESLFGILAGEQPVPVPNDNDLAFQAIQGQLDEYIIEHLPKEFWGSRFYLDSKEVIETPPFPSSYHKHKRKDIQTIHKLTSIANHADSNLLRFYNSRLSRIRTNQFLDTLCEQYKDFIDESALQKARERVEYVIEDLYTKAPYQKRKIV